MTLTRLISCTATNSVLFHALKQQFPGVNLTNLQRKHFSETKGSLYIRTLVIDGASEESRFASKYLAMGSVSALIKYVEFVQHVTFLNASLQLSFMSSQGNNHL
eukprot:TRINITY_DN3383_c0_g1_i5.p2 TRINITY_DN3383_c0_g1~~TRINITY_DN3383_c0_g1_i5.p2  ORF type:complete len:104 (-),score=15.20 TRINITY_DN3383_c0_g1_i5:521-832(-)